MALVLGGLDVVGDDLDGELEGEFSTIGAARRRARAARGGGAAVVPTPRWMNATTSQGVSRPQEDLDFLSFTPLVIAAGASNGTLTCQPQRPFRGERLILTCTGINPAVDLSYTATINPAIFVGAVQVGSTQGATPFVAFRPDAMGVRLSWPPAGQGTTINIPVVLTSVAPANGVAVTGTVFGRAMR